MGRGMLARFWEQGIHIVHEAGAEWREAGCSMCIAMNGDQLSTASTQQG